MIKTCEKCHVEFDAGRQTQKFCSVVCTRAGRQTKPRSPPKPCGVCATPFYNPHKGNLFCSSQCGYIGRRKRQKETMISRICETCGTAFDVTPSNAGARWCSKKCWNIRAAINTICRQCQTDFRAYKCNDTAFCSKRCYSAWQSTNQRGEAHPSWKGGSSRHYRRGADWKTQAALARERDKYQCVRCGIHQDTLTGGRKRLDVHHIIPWSISKTNVLSNLMSLCRKCHIAVEPKPSHVRLLRGIV
jgi:5-methylcytosine-specific restriction endonuclease McrA